MSRLCYGEIRIEFRIRGTSRSRYASHWAISPYLCKLHLKNYDYETNR